MQYIFAFIKLIEPKGKSTYGHGQQCGDWGEKESLKKLNGNGKNTIKNLKTHRNKYKTYK